MKRREFTKAQKAQIVLRATNAQGRITCEGCGLVLGAKPFEIDHRIAEALIIDKSIPLTIDDGQLLGKACCHRGGKTAADVHMIAKAKRVQAKHLGIKPTGQKMRGSRDDEWKKTFNHGWVRRDA